MAQAAEGRGTKAGRPALAMSPLSAQAGQERANRPRRAFIADTTALILFFTTTGIINERFVAGMTWEQVFHARLLGAVLMVPVGRPYGIWRDWIMQHARPDRLSQLLWDSLALGRVDEFEP